MKKSIWNFDDNSNLVRSPVGVRAFRLCNSTKIKPRWCERYARI